MTLVEKGWGERVWDWFSKRRKQEAQLDRVAQPVSASTDDMDREQLLDARIKLNRQIAILGAGPVNSRDATPQTSVLISDLNAALAEVNAKLQQLDAAESQDEQSSQVDTTEASQDADMTMIADLGDPSILSKFTWTMLDTQEQQHDRIWVTYLLTCSECTGGDMFSVSFYPKVAPDPPPYAGVAPGDTVKFAPFGSRCVQCGSSRIIFDPRTDGYDGVLKAGCGDVGAETDPTDETAAATLYVALGYRVPVGDLRSLASEQKVAPADLFAAIFVRGVAPSGSAIFEEQYDCSESQT